jgi:hypothetical protein
MFLGEGEGAKIVKEHKIGMVAPAKDYTTVKNKIQFIVSHPNDMTEMHQNCLFCAQTKFNRPKQIADLHQHLQYHLDNTK